jgi:hypothetical protein
MSKAIPGSIPLVRPEPIVKVDQIAWVIFDKADLAKTDSFLRDFGLHAVGQAGGNGQGRDQASEHLYRGAGSLPYCYIARPAAASAFVGTGFLARSREDLEALSRATGCPVEPLGRPGGGDCVRLTDPHGFVVEVAFGIEEVPRLPSRRDPLPLNTPFEKPRVNATQRPADGPAEVERLGHCVIQSTDFKGATDWYMRHLGLIPTDVQCIEDGRPVLAFMRTDRGAVPSDHHAFVVGIGFRDEFSHCAFEVVDIDALGQGQQALHRGGWKHSWGIGRHLLGSQLFDYWHDADGHEMEHYADGDVFDADHVTEYSLLGRGSLWQWGNDIPSDFGPQPGPQMLVDILRGWWEGRVDLATVSQLARAVSNKPRPWMR